MKNVIDYLVKLKEKYSTPKEFFNEPKNKIITIAIILLLISVPFAINKVSKGFIELSEQMEKDQAVYEEEKKQEEAEREFKADRDRLLNAKKRINQIEREGKDINEGIILSKEEIEKFDIKEEEIAKFNEDVQNVIVKTKQDSMVMNFKRKAKSYVKDKTISYITKVEGVRASFNEDSTICTVIGRYESKNEYGANIIGEFKIEFDTSSEEIINEFMGNEKII